MARKKSCGCHVGALFALAAIIICVVSPPMSFATTSHTLLADFGFVFAAALVGKIIGMVGGNLVAKG